MNEAMMEQMFTPEKVRGFVKKVIISPGQSETGTCRTCTKHLGIHEIPFGYRISDPIVADLMPPYHPNCTCEASIEYYDQHETAITRDKWLKIKSDFDKIYIKYKSNHLWGPFESVAKDFGIIKKEIENKYPGTFSSRKTEADFLEEVAKCCADMAEDIKNSFEYYLHVNRFKSVVVRLDKLYHFHEWVVVSCNITNKDGTLLQEVEYYDPWLIPDWLSKILVKF